MIELLKNLVYIEIGNGSVLINMKWGLVVVVVLVAWFMFKRTLLSFTRRAK